MGVAVGDYNNDGYPDMFVTGCGRALLYRNNGNGTFSDVTKQAGIITSGWTTSAVWFDFDNDGRLDLFVCSFVRYLPEDRRLIPQLTVEENLLLPAWAIGSPDPAGRLASIYRHIPELRQFGPGRASQLSGGQQKLVALGRAGAAA